jgi:hypothetical protein
MACGHFSGINAALRTGGGRKAWFSPARQAVEAAIARSNILTTPHMRRAKGVAFAREASR